MSKRYIKKDRDRFTKEMAAFFASLAFKTEEQGYLNDLGLHPIKYYLNTPYGVYEVRSIDPSDNILSVMGAFRGGQEQYANARNHGYACNPFTGKWNFHLDAPVQDCIDHIQDWFTTMMQLDKGKVYPQ